MSVKYNKIERYLASALNQFPWLKNIIKRFYQYLNYFIHKPRKSYSTPYNLQKYHYKKQASFFGYYDKCPESYDGKYIAFHSSKKNTKHRIKKEELISIIIYNKTKQSYFKLTESNAFNWQQGSRVIWLPGNKLIFNNRCNNEYCAELWDVPNATKLQTFHNPVAEATCDFFLSFNYHRLAQVNSDYAYSSLSPEPNHLPPYNSDGIHRIDFKTGTSRLLVSFNDILKILPDKAEKTLKINHVMLNPSATHFLFILRSYKKNKKHDSLFVADAVSGQLKCLSDSGMISHCCWIDDNSFVGYLRPENKKAQYYKMNRQENKFVPLFPDKIGDFGDGHPSFMQGIMVFDTYPDKSRMKNLLYLNIKTGVLKVLGSFFEPLTYHGFTRCDLHPRLSRNGKHVFFDSVHDRKRFLYKMNISQNK